MLWCWCAQGQPALAARVVTLVPLTPRTAKRPARAAASATSAGGASAVGAAAAAGTQAHLVSATETPGPPLDSAFGAALSDGMHPLGAPGQELSSTAGAGSGAAFHSLQAEGEKSEAGGVLAAMAAAMAASQGEQEEEVMLLMEGVDDAEQVSLLHPCGRILFNLEQQGGPSASLWQVPEPEV